ncbi:enoyl-CoA hydratase/isomerase family protein [bacterium]|nr:enoyl-CoA hydratase/isomerase family protein [bacterium]
MKNTEELIIEKDGAICTLTINNPSKRNALTPNCLAMLTQTFEALSDDSRIRVVVLRGSGEEAFSAGADITAMPSRDTRSAARRSSDPGEASRAIINYPFPVIAMLHGYTLGAGCVLAMSCDIRIASKTVKVGIPTSRMGLLSSHQGFKRFMAVLGFSTAMEIFLTGRSYDSQDCLQMGMVNHLVEPDQVEDYTYQMAKEVVRCAPLSLRGSKLMMNRIAQYPELATEDIEKFNALRIEAATSNDHEEAKSAFREKRAPIFTGS